MEKEKCVAAEVDAAFLLAAKINRSEWDMFACDVSPEDLEYVISCGPEHARVVVSEYQAYIRDIYNASEMSRRTFYRLRHRCSGLEELEREVNRIKSENAGKTRPPEFALLNHEVLNALSGLGYDQENVSKNRWKQYVFDGPGMTFSDVVVLSAIYKWIGCRRLTITVDDLLDVILPRRRHDEKIRIVANGWVNHLLSSLKGIRLYRDDQCYRGDEMMLCAEFSNGVLRMEDVPAFHSMCDDRWIKMPDVRGVHLERMSVFYILKRIDRIKHGAASMNKMLFSTAAKALGYTMDMNKLTGFLRKLVAMGIINGYKVTPRGVEFDVEKTVNKNQKETEK